jgi:hypothetical protein
MILAFALELLFDRVVAAAGPRRSGARLPASRTRVRLGVASMLGRTGF